MHLKEELVLKIAILAERFRVSDEWYVDVVLSLVKGAGDYVSEEIWYAAAASAISRTRALAISSLPRGGMLPRLCVSPMRVTLQ